MVSSCSARMCRLFAAGTFYYHGELVFWDVHDPDKTIIVSLDHERYKKLIVEVGDPVAAALLLRGGRHVADGERVSPVSCQGSGRPRASVCRSARNPATSAVRRTYSPTRRSCRLTLPLTLSSQEHRTIQALPLEAGTQ